MKTNFKEKLGYWAETLLMFGGLMIGIAMVCGGLYMIYTIFKALFN
jgi:hypothetical protein